MKCIHLSSLKESNDYKNVEKPNKPKYANGLSRLTFVKIPFIDFGLKYGRHLTQASDKHYILF